MIFRDEYARNELEKSMYANNCSQRDFDRVRQIEHSIGEHESSRLQTWMNGTKAVVSLASGVAGYFIGSGIAQQMYVDNPFPKIVGGIAALLAAKLVAKPAARAGLDLGLRL